MAYNYTIPIGEKSACAVGTHLPISVKQSVEVCNFIRGKKVEQAKQMLTKVIERKQAVPYKQFNGDVGHRKGKMAAGRYPIKACTHILKIIESAESNAQFKGLVAKDLILKQVCAQKAGNTPRYGRQRGHFAKRTHIEVVVEEKK